MFKIEYLIWFVVLLLIGLSLYGDIRCRMDNICPLCHQQLPSHQSNKGEQWLK